jgi:hypothetical protein
MHRSGTSAVAGLLVRLGAQPPKTLMEGDADNRGGYWESTVLCAFHERLLRAAGSRWDAAGRLDRDWCEAQATTGLGNECRTLLRAEYGDAPRFVLKDPRICRFVPFWLRLLQMEGVTPRAVLVHRNPLEVARSLSARNDLDREFSLTLWLRHVLATEFDTRATRRTLVRYGDLLENWHMVAQAIERDLGTVWPVRSSAVDAEIQRFVNPGLRHHDGEMNAGDVAPALADWIQRTSSALDRLHTRDAVHAVTAWNDLDDVRQELDRATDISESQMRALHQRIDDLQAERDRAQAERDRAQAERDRAQAERDRVQAERDRLRDWTTGLEHQVHVLEVQSGEWRRALVEAQQDADALRASLSWRITSPLRTVGRIFR